MERLIAAVRRHPCLWDAAAREYRDQDLKDAAWADVITHTDISDVKEVKLKWKKLRDSYRDALKRQSEGGAESRWKYSAHMAFLAPHMGARRRSAPSAAAPAPGAPAPGAPSAAAPAPGAPAPGAPAPGAPDDTGSDSEPAAGPAAPADPLQSFFSSMCAVTRRLPAPAQLAVKRALFDAVLAAEEAQLAAPPGGSADC